MSGRATNQDLAQLLLKIRNRLLQLCEFGLGLFENRDVGVIPRFHGRTSLAF